MVKPKKYDEVLQELNTFVYTLDEQEDLFEPSVAYCYRNVNKLAGTHYRIFVNSKNKELEQFLLMHEAGHILFRHSAPETLLDFDILKPKIIACYDTLKKYIGGSDEKEIYNYFNKFLFNIVTDWEVNSKYFDWDEFCFLEKLTQDFLEAENITGRENVQLLYPTRSNFPVGLTANEYLTLILQNPEEFFKNFENSKGNGEDENEGEGGEDESQSGNQSGDSNSKNSKSKNGDSSNQSDKDSDGIGDQVKKILKGISQEEKKENARKARERKERIANGKNFDRDLGDCGDEVFCDCDDWSDYKTLEKKILNLLNEKIISNNKRDISFYYNRNKYNSDICFVRNRHQEKNVISSMTVLLDVSGSIDEEKAVAFCNIFKDIAKKINKKCEIILWSESFKSRFFSNQEFNLNLGGGTNIGKGLKFLTETNLLPNTTLFVVSDFEDNLDDWIGIWKKKMFGVCWGTKEIIEYHADNKRDFYKMFDKLLVFQDLQKV